MTKTQHIKIFINGLISGAIVWGLLQLTSCTHTPNINNYTLDELMTEASAYCKGTLDLKIADKIADCEIAYIRDYCKLYYEADGCKELR